MNRVATTIILAALLALAFVLPLAPAAEAQTPAATVKDDNGNVVLQSFTGGALLAPNQGASSGDIPAEDAGARMMWYPGKAAFRAGEVGVLGDKEDAWNEVNVGTRSVAFGADTKASGDESTAMGRETTASGSRATAMGDRTTAATDNSLSLGKCNSANQSDDNTLLVVGNGERPLGGSFCDFKSDALVLDDAGNLEIAGDYKTTGGDLTLDPGSSNDIQVPNGDIDMNGQGNVVNTSDRRLKTAIEPIEDAVTKVRQLEPATYAWEEADDPQDREAGVIAQSVDRVLPEAVKEGDDGFLRLAYSQLTPLVISAVQEQQETIDDLESEVERKDDRIAALETQTDEQSRKIADLKAENEEIKDRLAALETSSSSALSAGLGGSWALALLMGLGGLGAGLLGAGFLALRRR
jgi:hypothetical protein